MRIVSRQILLFVLFVLFGASQAFAQGVTTAAMNGTVLDNDGQPMPGAVIVAVHVPTGTQFGTTSRADGKFNISNMRVGGPYTVKASFIGYKAQIIEGVNLSLGQNYTIDFKLVPESIEAITVSVVADRNAVISGSRTGASTNVGVEEIQAFPTVSRSFQDFAKLTPQFDGRSSSAAGRNSRFNNIQIDGTQYNDLFGLGSSGTPGGQAGTNPISLDAIQEFQVVIAPYDVRQGGFTGGGINAITRSGTNNFSGSVYGYYRNQNFMGYSPDDKHTKVTEFNEYQTGLRLGGPIIKDKLFFFANGEFTRRTDPADNLSLTQGSNTADKANLASQMQNILINKYGYNPGGYGSFSTERPSNKLFVRFDYNISDAHKLTFRHNFVDGSDQKTGRNLSTLEFADRMYQFNTNTNSSVLQLSSTFSNTMSNELIAGYTRIRDTRDPSGRAFPSILVRSSIPGFTLKAGAEEYSQANQLDQDIFELTDNFSYFTGAHVITVGTHNEFYKFRNLFIRNLYGYYEFNSMADLEAGNPSRYQLSFSNTGDPKESAHFSAFQFGLYAQDEWSVSQNMKLTFGLRVDAPIFPDKPAYNATIDSVFAIGQGMDLGTDKVPSGKILFSPRFGFNWDVNGDRTTQIRGGAGIFTGRIPYVWISNQYGNTGVEFGRIDLSSGRGLPNDFKFSSDPNNQPRNLTAIKQSEVDLTSGNFQMPQVARVDAAVDQQLPFGLTGTLEAIYSKSVNDLTYQDINIRPVGEFKSGAGDPGRTSFSYGTRGYSPAFTNVVLMKNTSKGYQYNVTAQVQGTLPIGLYTNVAYTYTRAKDLNSTVSSQALSQWRYNPVTNDPNNPDLATSNFEIRNRILVALSYTAEFFTNYKSTFTLYYNGQSGLPFSYTYDGDVNGDGAYTNDMIYVPKNALDPAEIQLGSIDKTTKAFVADPAMAQALEGYINRDNYLKEHRGQVMERNGAYAPWSHQIDFRFVQEVPLFAGHQFEISLDVLNLPNLIKSNWGWVKSVNFQNDSVIKYLGVDANKKPVFSFKDKSDPFQNDFIASRYQMQLGARYSF
ncbi:MAG TPA: carboxypeptidase regulatory-like domain-containing protein [Ignavibacteriales bacterium]|nr:carboxypeptidase regulatory-like domain-containing protein [Ignavibacteriales bacterium]